MIKEVNRIIGINPGTRYLGIATICDHGLLDWRVKTFTDKWSREKANKILDAIKELIELYDINAIVIKKLHPSRSSKNLNYLISLIKAMAKRKRIRIKSYSISELERLFIVDEKFNKKNLAAKIISEYPALIFEKNKEDSNKNSYHQRMIEAVALASASLQ